VNFPENVIVALKGAGIWLFFNALGIGVYLVLDSWITGPLREDKSFNKGDPVRDWLGTTFPLLALYLGINVTWLILNRKTPFFGSRQLLLWLLVCLVWGIVLSRDPVNFKALLEILNGTAWP
jgi:hypothetical protein